MAKNPMANYILDKDHNPVECRRDSSEWGRWMFENPDNRRVGYTIVPLRYSLFQRVCIWLSKPFLKPFNRGFETEAEVSTVFLGIDHSFGRDGPLVLFETMIFGGKHDEFQCRYSTWDEAVAGHAKAVEIAGEV